jgi:hypothetical protein
MAFKEKNRLTTTIAISKKNRQTLVEIGRKDQSFDQILGQVLEQIRNAQGERPE